MPSKFVAELFIEDWKRWEAPQYLMKKKDLLYQTQKDTNFEFFQI